MADIADDADGIIEQQILAGRARAANARPLIGPQGHCLNCGEEKLPDGSPWPPQNRWCDADCKADWTRATGVR